MDELFLQFYPDAGRSPEPEIPAPVSAVLDYIITRAYQIAEEKGGDVESMLGSGEADTTCRTDNQRLVSSKGIQAVIDLDKYEAGDRGDCILMDQVWVTPDTFLQKTGNRRKNHMRSISVEGSDLGTALDKWNKECIVPTLTTPSKEVASRVEVEACRDSEGGRDKDLNLISDKALDMDKSRLKNTGKDIVHVIIKLI